MMESQDNSLVQLQRDWLKRFDTNALVDVHCHCLPGLDDGPGSWDEALSLCKALVRQGITTVVATPHQLGRYDGHYDADTIRDTSTRLNGALLKRGIPLRVLPGAEIRVDERILPLLKQGQLLTMGDQGRLVLLELPYEVYFDLGPLLAQLSQFGLQAIIAHPERNRVLALEPQRIKAWMDYNPVLQITGASLLGRFGTTVQRASFQLLDMPFSKLVATDAHDLGARRPCFAEAFEMTAQHRGQALARQLFVEEPLTLMAALSECQKERVTERRA